jgi:hypothetical protein
MHGTALGTGVAASEITAAGFTSVFAISVVACASCGAGAQLVSLQQGGAAIDCSLDACARQHGVAAQTPALATSGRNPLMVNTTINAKRRRINGCQRMRWSGHSGDGMERRLSQMLGKGSKRCCSDAWPASTSCRFGSEVCLSCYDLKRRPEQMELDNDHE